MADLYHFFVMPKRGVTREAIEEKLNLATDWYRYHSNAWIVLTGKNADIWMERLKPLIEPDGNAFICRLDFSSYNGYMSEQIWPWIKKHLDGKNG